MENYICQTCGVQHAASDGPPPGCLICQDERQYIGPRGQQWTTLAEMRAAGYRNRIRNVDPGLDAIDTRPRFAIGQRALLVQTHNGNFLWDNISYVDGETVDRINEMGGLAGISVSHPHFYGVMIEWSHVLGGVPVYIPAADREWVVRPDPAVRWYEGSREILPGLTLVQCGGHFDGSAVLHWAAGADGRGALLTGDTIAVAQDRRYVTFMRSYPNYIPLSATAIGGILDSLRPYRFDRIYGAWWESDIRENARQAVERSAERYIHQISG